MFTKNGCFVRWHVREVVGLGEEMGLFSSVWGTSSLCHDDSSQPKGQQHLCQLLIRQNHKGTICTLDNVKIGNLKRKNRKYLNKMIAYVFCWTEVLPKKVWEALS